MITLIVPTRNRAHTLRVCGESYFQQDGVSEIIFVDDGGTDDTAAVLAGLMQRFPGVPTKILRNEKRMGAAYSRIRGYEAASNALILFSDDDTYLTRGYARTLLDKMQKTGAAIVAGRVVHKKPQESFEAAIRRFGDGTSPRPSFKNVVCEFNPDARFQGDIRVPLIHATILTRRDLLQRFSYDPFYSKGNGYREESDFQMNAYVNGYDILLTSDAWGVELSRQENPSGGQRVSRLQRLFWNIYYTNYFFRKYYARYAARRGVRLSRHVAIAVFALYQVHVQFIRPWGKLARRLLPRQEEKRTSGISLSQVE